MKINLHIERLVLDGVNIAPGQHHLLQANVTRELARIFNTGSLAHNLVEGGSLPRLSTGSIKLIDNKPKQLGRQIANSVYGGIGCG